MTKERREIVTIDKGHDRPIFRHRKDGKISRMRFVPTT